MSFTPESVEMRRTDFDSRPLLILLAGLVLLACSDDDADAADTGLDSDVATELDTDDPDEEVTEPEPELVFRAPQTDLMRGGQVYTVLCIQRDAEGNESDGDLVVTAGDFEPLSGVGEFLYTAPEEPSAVTFTCQWPELELAGARTVSSLPFVVAYFPLDGDLSEATGAVEISDVSLPEGVTPAADHAGNEGRAVRLDGQSALTIPHNEALNVQGERTIMFRARVEPQGPDTVFVEKGASEDTSAYRVMMVGNDADLFNLDLRYAHASVADTTYSFYGREMPAEAQWVQIAVSVGNAERLFVLDDRSSFLATGNFPSSIENDSPLYIGNGGEGENGLVGEIDNLLIFDAPLTEAQINAIWETY